MQDRKHHILKRSIKILEEIVQETEDKVEEQRLGIEALEAKEEQWTKGEHARKLDKEMLGAIREIMATPGFPREAQDALMEAINSHHAMLMVFGDDSPAVALNMESLGMLKMAFPQEARDAAQEILQSFCSKFEKATREKPESGTRSVW